MDGAKIIPYQQNNSTTQLSLFHPPPVITYLQFSFQLSILLGKENTEDWYFSNFIQLFSKLDGNSIWYLHFYPDLYLFEGSNFFIDATDVNEIICSLNKKNLIEKICQWIDEKYYVTLILAECEIKGTAFYNKYIYPHPQFIFGYNLNTKTFKVTNFNEKNKFSIIDVGFDNIIEAFFSKKKDEAIITYNSWGKGLQAKHPIILYKFREWDDRTYILDKTNIQNKILDYIYPHDSSLVDKLYRVRTQEFENSKWGINIYENLIVYLTSNSCNRYDYRAFHCLWEHKKIMVARLKYLRSKNYLDSYEGCINDYKKLEKDANQIRLLILKYNMKNKLSIIKTVSNILYNMSIYELEVLRKICDALK